MDSLSNWLEMGGYGRFIWSAYAVGAVLLIGLLVASLRTLKHQSAELAASERTPRPRRTGSRP